MADGENIDDIVSSKAIKSIIDAENALRSLNKQLQEDILSVNKLNQALGGSNNIKEFNANLYKTQQAQQQVIKATASAQLQEERLAKFRENEARKEEARLDRLKKARDKALSTGTGAGDYNPYKELENQYKAAAMTAQNLGAQLEILKQKFGSTPTFAETARLKALAKSFEEASNKANGLHKQLLSIDQTVGKSQRNVGNYKSGWNGLGNSIQQISRELPAFTYSIQTGFMALSNNIPILFDEIRKTKTEIAALKAEGKDVPSLFKQIASSVFSWGTLLSIGITLFTVYGKEIGEFIKAVFKGTKALDYFALSQKEFNEVRRNGFKDAQTELINMQNLYRASQNTALAYGERKKAVDELQKQYPTTLGNLKDEDILAGRAGDAYKYLTQQILATSFASAASSKISENRIRDFDNEEKRIKARIEFEKEELNIAKLTEQVRRSGRAGGGASTGAIGGGASAFEIQLQNAEIRRAAAAKTIREANIDSEELNKRNLKLINEIDKATQKYGVTVLGVKEDGKPDKDTERDARKSAAALIDIEIERLKQIADERRRFADDDKNSLEDRLKAQEVFEASKYKISDLSAKRDVIIQKRNANEIKAIYAEAETEKGKVLQDSLKFQQKLYEDADKALIKSLKDGAKQADANLKEEISNRREAINIQLEDSEYLRSKQEQMATEAYAEGILSRKQYEDEIYEINRAAAIRNLEILIKSNEEIIKLQQSELDQFGIGNQKDINDNLRKNAELKIKLSKLSTDVVIKNLEREAEARKAVVEKEKELLQEVFKFGTQLVSQAFENRVNALNEEKDKIEENKNLQIENVQESILSEEDKAERIAVINAQAEQRQQALDARIREEKRRQAIADKAAAIAQVIINIALAQTKTLATTGILGLPLNAIIAAIGAVQIAAIVAQPIPKFKDGGTVQRDGIIQTGEAGVELRINPDGTKEFTDSKTNLSFAKAGTKIVPNHELVRMMAKPDKMDVAGKSWDVSPLIAESRRGTAEVKKSIEKLANTNKRNNKTLDMASWRAHLKRNGF